MRAFIVIQFLLILSTISIAQNTPELIWQYTFGGNNNDLCYSIVQTDDGGFALAGYTQSYGAGGKICMLSR